MFCDGGAKLYRLTGTIDGQTVDFVVPATIPGNVRGVTLITLHRGDTSFRTSVFTYGDCDTTVPPVAPPAIAPTVNPPTVTPPAAKPPAAKPKPKPKVRKPVAKKPKPKTVHKCQPLRDGTKRVWVKSGPDKGCQIVRSPEPEHLTG